MMKQIIVGLVILSLGVVVFAESKTLYENNFEKAEVGQVPSDFLVLDGSFAVKEEGGNKFLELPGTPLDSFAVQFGPAQTENVAVSARINGMAKGRRYPTFGVGINGAAGHRLQIAPAKKVLELYKDQQLKKEIPYEWKSGQWTKLRLQLRKVKEGQWKVEAKAWQEESPEPQDWMIVADENETPSAGRESVFASPFSGARVRFDDLVVTAVQ